MFLKLNKKENRLDDFFLSDVGGLSDYPKLIKVIKMILVLFHGQGCVERGFIVNKDMLHLEGMSLISQRMIYDHLVSNDLSPQSITITKELRDSVRKACSRQRIDLAERKEKEASDGRTREAEALTKDINKLKSKKVMLEKLQETLKRDSESLLLKAAEDSTKALAYTIEAKSIMDERKRNVVETEKLADTINSLEKKQRILILTVYFFELVNCFYIFSSSYHIVLCYIFVFCFWF